MIITEQKTRDEIVESLNGSECIFLVGCGECSTTCKTGGEPELGRMKAFLEGQGKRVTGICIPNAPCVLSQSKAEIAKNMQAAREAQAILVLACGLGVQSVRESIRWDAAVIPACNTLCGAVVDAQGNFSERCSLCGECILAHTAAVCPTTLCPKGLLNGPCGGMKKGKCEVDSTRDCAWVVIYNSLAKQNKVSRMKTIRDAKNHLKSSRPHYIMCS